MMGKVRQRSFGYLPSGCEASLYEFSLDETFSVSVSDFGASLIGIVCPDQGGGLHDVVLGCASVKEQSEQSSYLGSIIGRVAGRISNATFDLNGQSFALSRNEGCHHLHGGANGFAHRLWNAEILSDGKCGVEFLLVSEDGDQGYPGQVVCKLRYELTGPGSLSLTYFAQSNIPTPFNPTSHAYFNLEGHDAGTIADHWLQIFAEKYTPTDAELIPTGFINPVAGTEFDFLSGKRISENLQSLAHGYDGNFILEDNSQRVRTAAVVKAPRSGRRLTVATDRPCLHLYTGGRLSVPFGKGGARYGPFAGLSLETQGFPDALNHPSFPIGILAPDQPFNSQTNYIFDTETPP